MSTAPAAKGKASGKIASVPLALAANEGTMFPAGKMAERKGRRMQTLLLVEDNVPTCEVMTKLLVRGGYRVLVAHSGPAALQLLSTHAADLAILDVMMPEMDGLQVLQSMRADPRTQNLPVIIFTAVNDRSTRDRAKALGAADYWLKGGIGFADMMAAIKAQLAS
jgi:CheY-like chemotaxis protein